MLDSAGGNQTWFENSRFLDFPSCQLINPPSLKRGCSSDRGYSVTFPSARPYNEEEDVTEDEGAAVIKLPPKKRNVPRGPKPKATVVTAEPEPEEEEEVGTSWGHAFYLCFFRGNVMKCDEICIIYIIMYNILYCNIYIYIYTQCEAPKTAKLVYNSNNYGLWYL